MEGQGAFEYFEKENCCFYTVLYFMIKNVSLASNSLNLMYVNVIIFRCVRLDQCSRPLINYDNDNQKTNIIDYITANNRLVFV